MSDGVSRKANSGEWSECLYYQSEPEGEGAVMMIALNVNINEAVRGGLSCYLSSAERSRGQLMIIQITCEGHRPSSVYTIGYTCANCHDLRR